MTTQRIYSVIVTETTTASMKVIVLAPSLAEAERVAESETDFTIMDFTPAGIECSGSEITAADLGNARRADIALLLAESVPGSGRYDNFNPAEFLKLLSHEAIEAARLAAIEAGNGQLTLELP